MKKVRNGFRDGDAGTVEVGCYHWRVERAGKSRRYPPQRTRLSGIRGCAYRLVRR